MPEENGALTGLRATTLRGLSRTGVAHVGSSAVNLFCLAFASRYLSAEAFGTEAAASMLVGIWAIAADLGMGRAVIQRRDLDRSHLTSALWGSLVVGLVSTVVLWNTATFWAGFLSPESKQGPNSLAAILPWMGLGLGFASVGSIPRAMLERSFSFGRLAALDFAAALAGGAALVTMSVSGYGVWSLVGWFLVRTGLLALGPWIFHPLLPGPPTWSGMRDLLSVGGPWVGSQLAGYGQQNLDYLFIIRFLGVEALGYYSLAYRLVALAQIRLVPVVLRVTFPAFSALQEDLVRLRRAFLTTVRYVALLVFPLMAGFALLAEPGIRMLYGPDFDPSSGILLRLAPGGAARGVSAVTGLIFLSLGRTGIALAWALGSGVVTAAAIWAGLQGGVYGVALAMSLSGILLTVASFALAGRLVGIGLSPSLRAIGPGFAGCIGMTLIVGGILWTINRTFTGGLHDPGVLIGVGMVSGILSYGLVLRLAARETWGDLRGVVMGLLGRDAD